MIILVCVVMLVFRPFYSTCACLICENQALQKISKLLCKICLTLQRFGTALVPWGQLHLKHKQYVTDLKPIDRDCGCSTCKHHSRAYINSLLGREEVACHLITIHNIYYQASILC